jgi:membrane associated rhomboid family serine protease
MDWRSSDTFPAGNGEWAVARNAATTVISEEDAKVFAKAVSSRMGAGGPLISSPAAGRFLPPIRVPELQAYIVSLIASKLKSLALIAISFALVCALLLAKRPNDAPMVARMAGLLALIAAFWFYNYRVASRDRATYLEWSIYLDWQKRFAGANYYVPLVVVGAFGLLQLACFAAGYDRDVLFYEFGVVFASIDRGEYWRFLVGPFLHASATHWTLNFVLCLLVLPYLTPYKNRWGVLLLGYAATVLSAAAVYAQFKSGFGSNHLGDSFAGVSAFIYFVCGFAIANTVANQVWYPRRYVSGLAVSTFILLASPHVVNGSISFVAHATGLIVGLCAGLFFKPDVRKP